MLPEKIVLGGRRVGRLERLAAQVVELDAYAQVGVGLDPVALVAPLVLVVDGKDQREERVVLDRAFQDLGGVVPLLPANAGAVGAGRGDDEDQRLRPGAGGRVEHVEQRPRLVRVQLVDDSRVDVQAVVAFLLGTQRLELRIRGQEAEIVLDDGQPPAEVRRLAHHADRFAEHDAGLVAFGGAGIDLGSLFAVGHQQIERDARGQRALAVLAGDLSIGSIEAALAVGPFLPAEQHPQPELLPRFELDRLLGPLALRVAQVAEEVNDVPGGRFVEVQAALVRRLQVAIVTLDGQTDPLRRDDLAGAHHRGVLHRGAIVHPLCLPRVRKVSKSSASGFSLLVTRDRAAGVRPNSIRNCFISFIDSAAIDTAG